MNCSTPPSPPSPNLLYSGYPRAGVGGPPTTSMSSFSPAAPSAYSHMHMSQIPSYSAAGCYQGSELSHYGDMRSASTGWYSSPATDPRFASEYCKLQKYRIKHQNNFSSLSVSSLMRGPSSSMGGMPSQMSGLTGVTGCSMDAKQHIQFPLSQRRKRRVLFTQAQVGSVWLKKIFEKYFPHFPCR